MHATTGTPGSAGAYRVGRGRPGVVGGRSPETHVGGAGALVAVTFKSIDSAAVVDLADGLQWASPQPTDGFSLPPGSTLQSLAPLLRAADTGAGLSTELVYGSSTDPDRKLDVFTCPDGIGDCPDLSYANYLDAWIHGSHEADGSTTVSNLMPNGEATYDQLWPNGGAIEIDTDGQPLDATSLQHIVDSIRVTDTAGLASLRTDLSHRASELPLLGTAALADGRVELRGAGS